jgi:hypothetical protein
MYTQSLEEDQDNVSTCAYTEAKACSPTGQLQEMMQRLVIRNIKVKQWGMSPTSITICLQTSKVNKNNKNHVITLIQVEENGSFN